MYVYIYIYVYTCIDTCIHTCIYIRVRLCLSVCLSVYVYAHISLFTPNPLCQVFRTFCYVDDACEAVIRMVENPDKVIGHTFNVGNPDNNISISNLAQVVNSIYNHSSVDIEIGLIRASCLPDSAPYGRDGLAHSRSLSPPRGALCVLPKSVSLLVLTSLYK